VHGPDTFEWYPNRITEVGEFFLIFTRVLGIGDPAGQSFWQQLLIAGNVLEVLTGRTQIGGHEVELETLGQGFGQPYQDLARIGHSRQLAARSGEE
jgi:hypothetical protein